MNAITPEVLGKDFNSTDSKEYNIHLSKIENNKTYNKIDNSNTTTNNITNNNNKSFLRSIFQILFFPIVLPYKIIRYIIIKYNFKGNYNKFKKMDKESRSKSKILKKVYDISNFDDEIF